MTMGYNGHTNDTRRQAVIITETAADKTAFNKSIDTGEHTEYREWIAETIMDEMRNVEPLRKIEYIYVGTVCDNVGCNRTVSKIIEREYSKLFTPGCFTHVADSTMESMCKVEEIRLVVEYYRFVAVLVKSFRKVKKLTSALLRRKVVVCSVYFLIPDSVM